MKEKKITQNDLPLEFILGKRGLLTAIFTIVFGVAVSFAQAPPAPVATAATSVTATSFSANWGASVGAITYFLDVSTDIAFGSFVGIYNNFNVGNVTSFNATGLSTSTYCYYYRVRAYDGAGGFSLNSNTISVGACSGTDIAQLSAVLQMKVYPNPVKDKLFVQLNNTRNVVITISDILGKEVKTISENELTSGIEIANLENGIYFLKVKHGSGELIERIIVNR